MPAATVQGYVDVVGESDDGGVQVALLEVVHPIPSLQVVGLMILSLLLLVTGFFIVRRKRTLARIAAAVILGLVGGGIWLSLAPAPAADNSTTFTSANGFYQFTGVMPDRYSVSAFKDSTYFGSTPILVVVENVSDIIDVDTVRVTKIQSCPAFAEPTGIAASYPASPGDLDAIRLTADWGEVTSHTKGAGTELLESEALHVQYSGTTASAVVIPIENKMASMESQYFVAYFDETGNTWASIILSITGSSTAEPYPERIAVLTPAGEVVSAVTFDKNGDVLDAFDADATIPTRVGYWACVGKCLKGQVKQWPWWLRAACGGACGLCFTEPSKVTCIICAGCLAGRAIYCLCVC